MTDKSYEEMSEKEISYISQENYNISKGLADDVSHTYTELLNQGHEPCKDTLDFALYKVQTNANQTARPIKDFKKNNETATHQVNGVMNKEINNLKEEIHIDSKEKFIKSMEIKYKSVKEDKSEINWNYVQNEVSSNIRKRLRKPEVSREMKNQLKKYSNFNYKDIEYDRIINTFINEVSNKEATHITNQIKVYVNSDDLETQEQNIKKGIKKSFNGSNFWKGMTKQLGKSSVKVLKPHIKELLISMLATIVTYGGLIHFVF